MLKDIRYALRTFAQSPGFAFVTVLILGLGIGANTAIFSVVNAALIRPLPYDHPERLVAIAETRKGGASMQVAGPNFRDWRSRAHAFESLVEYFSGPSDASGMREPERLEAAAVSSGFFRLMRAQPIAGRTFLAEEEKEGAAPVAMIGEALWRRGYGADPHIDGHSIKVLGTTYTIVGVMPAAFDFPRKAEVWAPLERQADPSDRTAHNYRVIGRLRDGESLVSAQAQMKAIMEILEREYPASNKDLRARLTPLQEQASSAIRPTLLLLLGSVGFVLLISCVNVANLLIARAGARRREFAVRIALGAGTGRLLSQLLTESMLLSLGGGALGLLLAAWTTQSAAALIPQRLLSFSGAGLDTIVILFALGISLLTGLFFGLAPAILATRGDTNEGLKASSRTVTASGNRLRGALIAFEIALSFVLLAGAGLTARSLLALQSVDTGFDARNVLVADLSFPSVPFEQIAPYVQGGKPLPQPLVDALNRPARLYAALIDRLKETPGVLAAGAASEIPLVNFGRNGGFEIEGRPNSGGMQEENYLEYTLVSEDYFRTMGIPVKRGRVFETSDRPSPQVTVINEATARRFFPHESALGHRIRFAGFEISPQWLTIVGVVADTRSESLANEPAMAAYVPFYENALAASDLSIVVKVAPGASVASHLRAAIRSVNNETPIRISSLDALASDSVATPRLRAILIGMFALFAVVLAAIGVYGVISNTVNQRAMEIGVRMALGARPRDVLGMLLLQAARLTAIGLSAGLAGALALSRVLRGFLFEVNPSDPATLAALALVLGAVGVFAGLAPAWRAARLDPVTALREE